MKDESLESMKQSAGAEQRGVQLRGNWLLFARLSWVLVAFFSLSYFLFSLYVTIFLDPLDQGSAGITPARYPLPGKGLVLHTARPVHKDRPSLAAFLGQSTIGGTCFEHPL
jgi:hypothetical protein